MNDKLDNLINKILSLQPHITKDYRGYYIHYDNLVYNIKNLSVWIDIYVGDISVKTSDRIDKYYKYYSDNMLDVQINKINQKIKQNKLERILNGDTNI